MSGNTAGDVREDGVGSPHEAGGGFSEDSRLTRENDDLGAGRAAFGDDLETLDRRRTEELKLIGEYDS